MQFLNNLGTFDKDESVGDAIEIQKILDHLQEVDLNDIKKESQDQDWGQYFQVEQERGDGLAPPIVNSLGNKQDELIRNKPIRFSYLQSGNDGLLSSSEEELCSLESSKSGLVQGKVRVAPIMTFDLKLQSKSAQKSVCKYFSEVNPQRSMPSYRKTQFQGENIGVKDFQDASTCYCGFDKKKTMKKCQQETRLNCQKLKGGQKNRQSQDRYFEMYFGGDKLNEFGALSMLQKQIEKNKRAEKELEIKNKENQELRNLICKIKKIGSDKMMNFKKSKHSGYSSNKEGKKKQSLSKKVKYSSPDSIKGFMKKIKEKDNLKDKVVIVQKYKGCLKSIKKGVNKMKFEINRLQTHIEQLQRKDNRMKCSSVSKLIKQTNGINVRLKTENNTFKF